MNIVFLDYDGVVNTPIVNGYHTTMYYPSDNKVNNSEAVKLIQLLCEICECHIVVISSWRCEDNYADCLYNSGLSKIIKIVDFMPSELDKSKIINNYLQNHTVSNYIIIEDQYISGIPRHKIIKCSYASGFGIAELTKSIKNLKRRNIMKHSEFKNLYADLLDMEWKEKKVWELIKDSSNRDALTVAPHFIGSEYDNAKTKLMIVGRCLNGWEVDYPDCSSIENTLNSILNQPSRFYDAINEEGIPYIDDKGNEKRYYYSKSPFWRLIKKVSIEYNGEKDWNEKFVWSNLYKVSPRRGGNPSWRFIKKKIPTYINIIKKEIETCNPSHILFITDMNWLNPYEQENLRFGNALNIEEIQGNNYKYVVGKGQYNGAKIVVCVRPEGRPTDEMLCEIKDVFYQL